MRFFRDDPTKETVVKWYFVPRDRPWIGVGSAFSTQVWDRQEPQLPIGEIFRPHPYRNGRVPYAMGEGGFCGTPDQWEHGALSTDPISPYWPGTTIPMCCGKPPAAVGGGTATGGTVQVVNVTPVPGLFLSGDTPGGLFPLGIDCTPFLTAPPIGGLAVVAVETGPTNYSGVVITDNCLNTWTSIASGTWSSGTKGFNVFVSYITSNSLPVGDDWFIRVDNPTQHGGGSLASMACYGSAPFVGSPTGVVSAIGTGGSASPGSVAVTHPNEVVLGVCFAINHAAGTPPVAAAGFRFDTGFQIAIGPPNFLYETFESSHFTSTALTPAWSNTPFDWVAIGFGIRTV